MRLLWQKCKRHPKAVFLAVLVALVVIALSRPVVDISPQSCAKIQPYMTGDEVEAIIGGPPGWYDGVRGVQVLNDNHRESKDEATWTGSRGEIVYGHHGTHGIIGGEKATYLQVKVLHRSWSLVVAERLTRNAFGATGTAGIVEMEWGAAFALLVVLPWTWLAKWLVRRRWDGVGVGLLAVGATLASLLCVHAGGSIADGFESYHEHESFQLLGAGGCGLVLFVAGIWSSLRHSRIRNTA